MNILEAKNLTKKFKNHVAVDNVSFSLQEGEILGMLGPNGAGKTTTIQMLLGILSATSGEVSYFGKKLSDCRDEIMEQVNFSSTYTNLPFSLTVQENLSFISYLYKIKGRKQRIDKIVELFNLGELYRQKVGELSAGQLTRLNLAKAFINFPRVLLLDEPTASLDPDVAEYVRNFILEERHNFQVSIIITSHNMAEVEKICDRVIFLDRGRVVADDTPFNLAQTIEISHVELMISKNADKLIKYCRKKNYTFQADGKCTVIDLPEKDIAVFLQDIGKEGISYDEISIRKPTLEDYFLEKARLQITNK